MVNRFSYFIGALALLAVGLTLGLLNAQLPPDTAWTALLQPEDNLAVLLVQSYTLPRIAMALLAGGILGLASLLLQQIMANPLASDNTLGINAGAQFALFLCAIFAPQGLVWGASFVAVLGAALSLLLVLGLAARKTLSPLLLILAGLVVNLYLGAFSGLMMLFYPEEARGLALWGAGSLAQESWRDTQWLALQALPCFLLIVLFLRPFTILSLNDSNAQSLGVPVNRLRVLGVLICAYLIACVVSAVGMLGFIGLAAATLVRQFGVRSLKWQLISAFTAGAMLLGICDLSLQLLAQFYAVNLPTGAMTALFGTPLLLWLMFRALPNSGRLTENQTAPIRRAKAGTGYGLIFLGVAVVAAALLLGRSQQGWQFSLELFYLPLLELRYPRVVVALAVGILLAVAGVILQRLTQNPMASPELLGISSGTSMGLLVALFLLPTAQNALFWCAGILGAIIALAVLSAINQRNGMLPEKVLLTGMSLSALFDTLQRLALASGDPRAYQLLAWTSGSTQQSSTEFALPFFAVALLLVACSLLFSRWLALFDLQAPMAQALGLNLTRARWILILFCALLSALATLVIGPLSFIGLLVPHITRFLGVHRVAPQIVISALLGGLMMVFADWLGRQLLFPYEVPAGLVATLIGGSYFLLLVRRI